MITQTIHQYTINCWRLRFDGSHWHYAYVLHSPNRVILTGAVGMPDHRRDDLDVAVKALFAATMMIGDTDRDYFDHYTPSELKWAVSHECEDLAYYPMILENECCKLCGDWLYECPNWEFTSNDDGTYTCPDCED